MHVKRFTHSALLNFTDISMTTPPATIQNCAIHNYAPCCRFSASDLSLVIVPVVPSCAPAHPLCVLHIQHLFPLPYTRYRITSNLMDTRN